MSPTTPSDHSIAAIFDVAPNAMLLVDADGVISLANRAASQLFGYGPGELVGQRVGLLVPQHVPEGTTTLSEISARAALTQAPESATTIVAKRKDASAFSTDFRCDVMRLDEGDFVLASVSEVTERERAQKEVQAGSAALKKLVYVITHDLKAPLRGINLAVRWLRDELGTGLSPESEENLHAIETRVARFARLIDGLSRYSKAQRSVPHAQDVDLQAVVDELGETYAPRMCVTVKGEWPHVCGDRNEVTDVLHNLLDNAVRFHDRGQPHVSIAIASDPQFHRIAVTDDGPGIAAEQRGWVFELFTTLRPRDDSETTGIGLALCKLFVERWGGEIGIESAEPRGTTVWFTIPATHAAA